MKYSLKYTVTFILLMLSFSISGSAVNLRVSVPASECACQLSESSADKSTSTSANRTSCANKSQGLSISDTDLGIKSVEAYSSINNYRLRRIIESNDSLKDILHKFCLLRKNLLVLGQSKSYYSNKGPHYSVTSSDYYVFALRRILI